MASPVPPSPPVPLSQPGEAGQNHEPEDESKPVVVEEVVMLDSQKQSHHDAKTPEPGVDQQPARSDTPSSPGTLASFDWEDFEARYDKALRDADEQEEEILKQAGALSKVRRPPFGRVQLCSQPTSTSRFGQLRRRHMMMNAQQSACRRDGAL